MPTLPKLVIYRPLVWYASQFTPTVFVAIEGFVEKIDIHGKRGKIPVGGYGDIGSRNEKGDPENVADISMFHSRLWSAFSELMVTEYNGPDPTIFRVKYRGPTGVSADNPIFQFSTQLLDLGNMGGAKNTPSKITASLDIEGMVQRSIDGTTFADYF
jgi:hypothetical protein